MPIALRLEWGKCPDGYEIFDYGDAPLGKGESLVSMGPRGRYVRPISQRTKRVDLTLDGIADPLVFKFVRATSDAELIDFCSQYRRPFRLGD